MNIVISGGGTGGHIYPAIDTYKIIKNNIKDSNITYFGSLYGMEEDIIKDELGQINFEKLDIRGFKRSLSLENFKNIFKLYLAIKKSKKFLKNNKIDVVILTGGYVTGPIALAAISKNIPIIVQEQNSVPGMTNKIIGKKAEYVIGAFENNKEYFKKENFLLYGNPSAYIKKQQTINIKIKKDTLLIMSGSLGAENINKWVIKNQKELKGFEVKFVTGKRYYDLVKKSINVDNIEVVDYLYNAAEEIKKSNYIISRSGATTLMELVAMKKISITIPSPNVTANHQYLNAKELSDKGLIKMVLEKDINKDLLNELFGLKTIDKQKEINEALEKYELLNFEEKFISKLKEIVNG